MLDFKKLEELVKFAKRHGLSSISFKGDGFEFSAGIGEIVQVEQELPVVKSIPIEENLADERPINEVQRKIEDGFDVVTVSSPINGTFYAAPDPESKNFVSLDEEISSGNTLCIVEAMKMMNEIVSEKSGKIIKIHKKNGDLVSKDDALFDILVTVK